MRISGLAGSGIILDGQSIYVAEGAILDMSGGGMLSGAGFVSGRGGSVNVLNTPLVNANPATPLSKAGNKVYAVLPELSLSYAPIAPENGAGDPVIGQQVTIPAGVPGLPAGTYTLLPSNYALLPGAYRVELGAEQHLVRLRQPDLRSATAPYSSVGCERASPTPRSRAACRRRR